MEPPVSSNQERRLLRIIIRRSRLFYTPLSLLFLFWFLWTEQKPISENISNMSPMVISAIFGLVFVGHLLISATTYFLFRSQDERPSLFYIFAVHVNRLPARYLPGGIWQTVSRAADFSSKGMPGWVIVRVLATEITISVCVSALLGAGSLLFIQEYAGFAPYLIFTTISGGVGLVVTAFVLSLQAPKTSAFGIGHFSAGVCSFTAVWVLYGSAFFLFLSQFLGGLVWPQAVGVYLLSWLAGFLAFFAPQGIGVFEATSTLLLTGSLTAGFIGSMFAFRALSVIIDLTVWLLFQLTQRAHRAFVGIGRTH